ncbi:MAG: hypothetical protein WCE51_16570 [Chthoniobacterales bacterium]
MGGGDKNLDRVLAASGDELTALLHHADPEVVLALLDNPSIEETQLCILLERMNLPAEILEEVARRKPLLKNYRVKRALAFHPRTPRLVTLRLLRDLYLMDLVQLTLLPGIPTELKLNAEDQVIARLPQLPLGQKITLARRGTARLAGALLAEGHTQIVTIVLDNAYLTEAQVLKVLSREKLPPVIVNTIAHHRKWSITYNVRLALVRHPLSPLATVLAYLPELTVSDLRELAAPGIVAESLRKYLQAEVQRRIRTADRSERKDDPPDSPVVPKLD